MTRKGQNPAVTATAVILAGGKSSRMGEPKALLLFDGKPLIAHLVETLGALFAEIVIVAAPGQRLPELPGRLIRDEVPDQGPVGGIYYGLSVAANDLCFVTSCDVAFLNLPLISYLLSQIGGYDVVVPYWQQRFQPLYAVYRTAVRRLLKEQLDRGELRPVYLFDRVRTRRVDEQELRRFDPQGLSFFNMNTPDDYREGLKLWQQIGPRGENIKIDKEPIPLFGANRSLACTVEFFGAALLHAKTKTVALSLPEQASLSELFSALAEKLPALVGRVIHHDRNRLISGYACNINGLDFVRDPSARIRSGDRVLILSADAGG